MTNAKHYFGAAHPLTTQINQHLFIICPNNSGSTLLKNLLASSQHTWNLLREGQAMQGFHGVKTRGSKTPLTWAANPRMLKSLRLADNFDWVKTQKQWYFQAYSNSPDASIFVEKSPASLVYIDQYKQHFEHSRFLFMVRNPYACIEGICRRLRHTMDTDTATQLATQHIVRCLAIQRRNVQHYTSDGVFFSYEMLCDQPEQAAKRIQMISPLLNDIDYNALVPVKQHYNEAIRNMNTEQINNLSDQQLNLINQQLKQETELLNFFSYEYLN
ncbi:Uncharacterised protein [BD1-7 clade bacterium]|nr:Uncharacterised protein [BD1-7 clade bacterium]